MKNLLFFYCIALHTLLQANLGLFNDQEIISLLKAQTNQLKKHLHKLQSNHTNFKQHLQKSKKLTDSLNKNLHNDTIQYPISIKDDISFIILDVQNINTALHHAHKRRHIMLAAKLAEHNNRILSEHKQYYHACNK